MLTKSINWNRIQDDKDIDDPGMKTIYYIRLRQEVLSGTEVEGCVSCSL